jgi:hypothetical protein
MGKSKKFCNIVLAKKTYIWGVLKVVFFLRANQSELLPQKQTLSLRMHPQLINKDCK